MLSTVKRLLRPVKQTAKRIIYGEPVGRKTIAKQFLVGHGIEIGALHCPLEVPSSLKVRYVDRMSIDDLRAHYPELAKLPLVPLDLIEDGEQLKSLPDASEDFVIANHFLEHCQDPIGTIGNVMRVLKPGGVFFAAVPDKRSTFDCDRPITPLQHFIDDHENGPAGSRYDHYKVSVIHISGLTGADAEAETKRLMDADYSMHFHVWDMKAFLGLLLEAGKRLDFDIEFAMVSGIEIISILRKAGGTIEKDREKMARGMLALVAKKQ